MRLPRKSLQALTYLYCNIILDKRKKHIFNPWDRTCLSESALQYAGYDALYSLEVYHRMLQGPPMKITAEELSKILKKNK
jgi:ribonuclease D